MASVDRKAIPPVLIALASIASAVVYNRLPPIVHLPVESLLPFASTPEPGGAPRWIVVSLLPAVALVMWAAFRWAAGAAGAGGERVARRMFPNAPAAVTSATQFERFGGTYDSIVLGVVLLLLGVHAAVLAAAFEATGVAVRLVPIAVGASLVLMGNVMPRLRPNWVAGLRTERMLADPPLWRRVHRIFGAALVVSGLVTMLAGALARR